MHKRERTSAGMHAKYTYRSGYQLRACAFNSVLAQYNSDYVYIDKNIILI